MGHGWGLGNILKTHCSLRATGLGSTNAPFSSGAVGTRLVLCTALSIICQPHLIPVILTHGYHVKQRTLLCHKTSHMLLSSHTCKSEINTQVAYLSVVTASALGVRYLIH